MATQGSTIVRTARWYEYPALAALVARRLGPSEGRPVIAVVLRRSYLFFCALWVFVGYGALTVGKRDAVASAWALDRESRGLIRAAPVIAVLGALELALFALTPGWVRYAVGVVLAIGFAFMIRTHRARAGLRGRRRPRALFVSNLASRRPGCGREILDLLCAQADAEARYLCLEAPAVPGLLGYYRRAGLDVEGAPVRVGSRELVYMEREPLAA